MVLSLDQLVAQSGSAKTSKLSLDDLVSASKPTPASTAAVATAKATPAPAPAPTLASGAMGVVKGIGQQIKDAAVGSYETAAGGVKKIAEGGTPLEGLQAGVDVERGVAGVAFSPLAPVFSGIGTLINKAGDALSNSPTFNQNDIANDPNNPEVKALNLASGLGEIAMAILGAKTGELKPATAVKEAPVVPPEMPAGTVPSPIRVGSTPHADYAAKQGYESYTPHDQLPVIEMGDKSGRIPSPLPTIDAGAPRAAAAKGDFTVVPEKAPTSTLPPLTTIEKPVPRATQSIKPIEGTGATKTRGVSESLEASAVSKDLSAGFGDLPEFKGADFNKISADVMNHIDQDPATALRIAMGESAAPKGSIPEMYLNVLAKKALVEGDVGMIEKLANESKLAGQDTTFGQRIAALGYKKEAIDPMSDIRDIQKARAEAIARRSTETPEVAVKRAQSSILKTHTKETWGDFVNSITC